MYYESFFMFSMGNPTQTRQLLGMTKLIAYKNIPQKMANWCMLLYVFFISQSVFQKINTTQAIEISLDRTVVIPPV